MKSFASIFSRLLLGSALALAASGARAQSMATSNAIALDLRQVVAIGLGNLNQTYAAQPRVVTVATTPAGAPSTITYDGSGTPPTNAGSYAVVVTVDTATQAGRAEGTLVVGRADLTVTSDVRRLQGQVVPALGLTYAGFLGQDDASVLDEIPTATTSVVGTSPVGDYAVQLSGGADNNYNLILQTGNVRVISLPGDYEALLRDAEGLPIGRVAIKVTRIALTGSLTTTVDTNPFTIRGNLTVDIPGAVGLATVNVPVKGGLPYQLELAVTDKLTVVARRGGGVVATTGTAPDGARLAVFPSRQPAAWAGGYSLILSDPRALSASGGVWPPGAGHAVAKIDKAGLLKLTGSLADGTVLTGSFKSDARAAYRILARPYAKGRIGSFVAGALDLEPHPERAGRYYVSAARGLDMYWAKSAGVKDAGYREGFGPLGLSATLDPWQAPSRTMSLASLLGLASNTFTQGLGVPAEDAIAARGVPASLQFTTGTRITAASANTSGWTATVTPATGAFSGSYKIKDTIIVSGRGKVVSRTVKFSGMLRQGPANDAGVFGRGYFLQPALPGGGTTLSGELRYGARPTGTAAGLVKDGLTGAPVAGAGLRFETASGAFLAQTSTDAQGNYAQVLPAGACRVRITLTGYVTAILFIDVAANQTTQADAVLFAPDRAGSGVASGRVVNAFDASGVAGATVRLRAGVNATSGAVLLTTTADAEGLYSFQISGGSYTAEAVSGTFATGYANLVVVGGATVADQDVRLTPGLAANEIRIVLSWGATPSDLDSHLAGPAIGGGNFHVYYSNRIAPGGQANLDVDDTSSFGPETITLSLPGGGSYRYWVHDYTNGGVTGSSALSQQSAAKVVVYRGVGSATLKIGEFNVPAGRVGNAWVVFDLDGATGAITPRNQVVNVAGETTVL